MPNAKQKISTLVRDLHRTIVETQPGMGPADVIAALINLSTMTCIRLGLSRDEVLALAHEAYDHIATQLQRRHN
jgi:hypothetical protein